MDPMSALTVATAVLQAVTFFAHYGNRIYEFFKAQVELPKALSQTRERLGMVKVALEKVAENIKANPDGYSASSLNELHVFTQGLASRCKDMESILDKYLPTNNASGLERFKMAVLSIGKDKKVEDFANRMTVDALYLIPFQMPTAAGIGRSDPFAHLTGQFISNVPHRLVHGFVGQAELLKNITELFAGEAESEPSVVILQGMGGLGKTQAALEYCRQVKRDGMYSAILWIDASGKTTLVQGFEAIGGILKEPDQSLADPDAHIQYVMTTLSGWQKQWLLVFDNYDDPASFRIKDYFPASRNGNVLITTRSPDLRRIGRMIEVQGMNEEDALDLLFNRTEIDLTPENREDGVAIVSRLGYLPLAIDQMAAYTRERRETFLLKQFIPYYDNHMKEMLSTTPNLWDYMDGSSSNNNNFKSVFTTWDMSYSLLISSSDTTPGDIGVLDCFGYFDEKDISEEMFSKYFSDIDNSQLPPWLNAFADRGIWSSEKFGNTIRRLKAFSLISSFQEADGFLHVSIHPLVRDWIKLRQNDESMSVNFILAGRILCCWLIQQFWAHFDPDPFVPWGTHFKVSESHKGAYLAHVTAWENQFKILRPQCQPSFLKPKTEVYPRTLCVELCFAEFYKVSVRFSSSLSICEWLWNQGGDQNDITRQTQAWASNCLVELHILLRQIQEAEIKARRAVQGWELILEDNDPILLRSKQILIAALNRSYWAAPSSLQKDLIDEMEDNCRELVAKSSELEILLPFQHVEQMYELALVLAITNDEQKQRERKIILDDLISRAKSAPQQVRQWSYRTLNGLSRHCAKLEDRDIMSQQCLEIMTSRFGENHTLTISALRDRGEVLVELGKLDKAEVIAQDCIKYVQDSPPQDSLPYDSFRLMARIYAAKGEHQAAASFYIEALRRLQSTYKEQSFLSIQRLDCLLDLASCLYLAKDYATAENVWRLRLDIAKQLAYISEVVTSLRGLGMTLSCSGKPQLALQVYTEALQNFYETSISSQTSIPNLDVASASFGAPQQQAPDDEKALRRQIRVHGFIIVLDRAIAFARLETIADADREFRRAVSAFETLNPVEADCATYFLNMIVDLSTWMTDEKGVPLELAMEYARWALHQAKARLGDDHELVEEISSKLAYYATARKHAEQTVTTSAMANPRRRKRDIFSKLILRRKS